MIGLWLPLYDRETIAESFFGQIRKVPVSRSGISFSLNGYFRVSSYCIRMIRWHNIPDAHCVILERFGKYARTQRAGLKFYYAWEKIKRLDIEGSHWGDVANKEHYLIELAEQNTGTMGSRAYTKDNVEISVDASIFWQIVDPRKAVYESDCLPEAIRDRAVGVLRSSIGMFDFDELSNKREQLSRDTTEALVVSGEKWGVKFTRVEIQQLQTDGKTHEALLQQVEADRLKKAIIAEAQGNAERTRLTAEARKVEALTVAEAEEQVLIMEARGRREATLLESEGRAGEILNLARAQAEALELTRHSEKQYLRDLAEIVGPAEASRLLLAQKYLEGFENISQNPSDKVFLPNNFNAAFNLSTENRPSHPPDAESIPDNDADSSHGKLRFTGLKPYRDKSRDNEESSVFSEKSTDRSADPLPRRTRTSPSSTSPSSDSETTENDETPGKVEKPAGPGPNQPGPNQPGKSSAPLPSSTTAELAGRIPESDEPEAVSSPDSHPETKPREMQNSSGLPEIRTPETSDEDSKEAGSPSGDEEDTKS